jgi:hypothetical protein
MAAMFANGSEQNEQSLERTSDWLISKNSSPLKPLGQMN